MSRFIDEIKPILHTILALAIMGGLYWLLGGTPCDEDREPVCPRSDNYHH